MPYTRENANSPPEPKDDWEDIWEEEDDWDELDDLDIDEDWGDEEDDWA